MRVTQPKPLYTEPIIKRLHPWYIEYFSLDNGKRTKQHRLTCGLNRIKDIVEREATAQRELNKLRHALGFGVVAIHNLPATPTLTALEKALEIKVHATEKVRSHQGYQDSARVFKVFLKKEHLEEVPVSMFSKQMAYSFFDYLKAFTLKTGKQYRPKTVNNHILFVRSFFYELLHREYITVNPFLNIKKVKEQDAIQRAFEPHEKEIVLREIKKQPILFLAQTLLYRCAIRPIEITRLKPKYFDFDAGLIKIPGSETKQNTQTRIISLADEIIPFLKEKIQGIKPDWFIFGVRLKPDSEKSCGRNTLTQQHAKIIKRLKEKGELEDTRGLCFYSWKDTSAFDHIETGLDVRSLQELFGHADLNTTQRYFKRKGIVNQKIKKLNLGFSEK
jgi:integrase